MPGCRGHDRQDHGGIAKADLPTAPYVGVVAALVDVVEAEQVGEEATVEFRRFQQACNVLVAAGLEDIIQRRFRMTPAPGVLRGRAGLEVGDQMHLTSGHHSRCPSHTSLLERVLSPSADSPASPLA